MFRDFGWKFWVIGVIAAVIIGVPIITGTPPQLGLDLQGGTMLTYQLETKDRKEFNVVLQVLQKRLDILGLRQLKMRPEGPSNFTVQVPGVDAAEIERIKTLIQTSGLLWFQIVAPRQDDTNLVERILKLKEDGRYDPDKEKFDTALRENSTDGTPLPKDDPASYMLLENNGRISGRLLRAAYPTQDDLMAPAVGFEWGPEGARLFGDLTEKNQGSQLAVVLDGVVKSSPRINERIGARGIIEGRFTRDEVQNLVIVLQGGALTAKPKPESDVTVGPGLGRDSIERGKLATWISLALVLGFMILYYRGAGIVASCALLFNLALLVCTLILFEATLTLPGIAGIVLTVGMAIDANILIFERIREEKSKGMGLRQAIENGYGRAFWTIFDANLTTLITALILFQVGTGPIKGFAVTLSIGILTSMFCALFVTKAFFALLVVKEWVTEFRMMTIIHEPNIPFHRYRWKGVLGSVILICGGMTVFVMRGQEKYGIEFTGGVLFQVVLNQPMEVSEVRDRLSAIGPDFAEAEVQAISFTSSTQAGGPGSGEEPEGTRVLPGPQGQEFQIRIRMFGKEGKEVDPNTLKPKIDGAFEDVLAPVPFPELGPRDEIQKDPNDPGQGKIVFLVRLDPRIDEIPDLDALAAELHQIGFEGSRAEPGPEHPSGVKSIRVTTGLIDIDPPSRIGEAQEKLKKFFKESTTYRISEPYPQATAIGESVAYNLKSKALLAMVFAVFAIVLYITFRFEFKFAIAAIAALVHDVLFALGAVASVDALGLLDVKIDLAMVTAFLTIIGYSLNDTIVVFDRIRENLGGRKKLEYGELVNRSINQTLSRTLLTSLTTFVALSALFLAGVNVIRDFSFAMMIGVLVGTYSSIFIASPVLIFLRNREVAAEEKAVSQPSKAKS